MLFVPALARNLFSIGQAADRRIDTRYSREYYHLLDGANQVVMEGVRMEKLYKLLISVEILSQANIVCSAAEQDQLQH